jgi:teichuronic acid biosynthesis glycosyltransferase TuaG
MGLVLSSAGAAMTPVSSPLISVITPYRNSAPFLPHLAANLQAQTYTHWECLLVDHASTDHGPALARQIANADSRFRLLEIKDPRPFPALPRNAAVAQARGELVCFLDVDDLWHPEKLERQLEFHSNNQLEFSVTQYGRFHPKEVETANPGALPKQWRGRRPPTVMNQRKLSFVNPIPMLTVMLNRKLLTLPALEYGPFSLIHHEDYLLWLTLWKHLPNLNYGCLNQTLAFHRRHSHNLTGNRWRMLSWSYKVYRANGEQPLAAALQSTRHALLHLFVLR